MSGFIKYVGVNEAVYENIKNMILTGDLLPGTKLKENFLCEKLGASKTPIKIALAKLEQDGLVNSAPRKGAFVIELDRKKVSEIYLIRSVLEGLACNLAAKNISKKNINILEKLLNAMKVEVGNRNSSSFLNLDEKFHSKILEIANISLLKDQLNNIYSWLTSENF